MLMSLKYSKSVITNMYDWTSERDQSGMRSSIQHLDIRRYHSSCIHVSVTNDKGVGHTAPLFSHAIR